MGYECQGLDGLVTLYLRGTDSHQNSMPLISFAVGTLSGSEPNLGDSDYHGIYYLDIHSAIARKVNTRCINLRS